MTNIKSIDTCFQCGEKIIKVKEYKDYINNSLVTTTESICSDPKCQKRTEDMLKKEIARRQESLSSKNGFGNRNQPSKNP